MPFFRNSNFFTSSLLLKSYVFSHTFMHCLSELNVIWNPKWKVWQWWTNSHMLLKLCYFGAFSMRHTFNIVWASNVEFVIIFIFVIKHVSIAMGSLLHMLDRSWKIKETCLEVGTCAQSVLYAENTIYSFYTYLNNSLLQKSITMKCSNLQNKQLDWA